MRYFTFLLRFPGAGGCDPFVWSLVRTDMRISHRSQRSSTRCPKPVSLSDHHETPNPPAPRSTIPLHRGTQNLSSVLRAAHHGGSHPLHPSLATDFRFSTSSALWLDTAKSDARAGNVTFWVFARPDGRIRLVSDLLSKDICDPGPKTETCGVSTDSSSNTRRRSISRT